jgi:hypothetical protein
VEDGIDLGTKDRQRDSIAWWGLRTNPLESVHFTADLNRRKEERRQVIEQMKRITEEKEKEERRARSVARQREMEEERERERERKRTRTNIAQAQTQALTTRTTHTTHPTHHTQSHHTQAHTNIQAPLFVPHPNFPPGHGTFPRPPFLGPRNPGVFSPPGPGSGSAPDFPYTVQVPVFYPL